MIINEAWKIPDPENANIVTMLKRPPQYYADRLKKIGFKGKNTFLLDAGCGAGHWSVAACRLNQRVFAIDLTEKYLSYAKSLKSSLKIKNLDLTIGSVEKLPYPDEKFDYIICYSVWMFTDKAKTLKEFYRVLKPGGRLYLGSLIGHSWYPKLILKGLSAGNRSLVLESIKAISRKIPVSRKQAEKMLSENGFKTLALSSDGKVGDARIKVKPIYSGKIIGVWEVFEILAEKINRKEK